MSPEHQQHLLENHLKELEKARAEGYEQGWKDARAEILAEFSTEAPPEKLAEVEYKMKLLAEGLQVAIDRSPIGMIGIPPEHIETFRIIERHGLLRCDLVQLPPFPGLDESRPPIPAEMFAVRRPTPETKLELTPEVEAALTPEQIAEIRARGSY